MEKKEGQSAEEQTPAVVPDETPQEPVLPEKFKGKSAVEIAKAYEELETQLGKHGDELGKLKKETEDLQAYKAWYDNYQAQQFQKPNQGQAEPQPQKDDIPDDEWIDGKTVKQIVQKSQKETIRGVQYELVKNIAPIMKAQAKQTYPQLFEGLNETELDQIMYGGIQAGHLNPNVAASLEGWAMAAGQLQLRNRNFQFNAPPPNPSTPTPTENVASTKRQDDEELAERPRLDATTREILEARPKGMSEEEFFRRWQNQREGRE